MSIETNDATRADQTAAPARPSSVARAREIAVVLSHHGLWRLIEAFGLSHHLPLPHLHRQRQSGAGWIEPAQVRLALEELGPTFMKLGQVLSTRSDLLPPVYLAELALLQDAAPEVPADKVLSIIEAELGQPAGEAFASFDPRPVATGSIGQAHLGTLSDGTEVVVKVRRPEAVAQIEEDLHLLHRLAEFADQHWEAARDYDVVGLVGEFGRILHDELDYGLEARNTERFAENFRGSDTVHVPRVFRATSTAHVLTLERIRGIKVTDSAALDAAAVDRSRLARKSADTFLKMIFEDGFFHADPHPGNLFIEPPERIGLIDFGMVGVLDEGAREGLGLLIVGMLGGSSDRVIDALVELGVTGPRIDRAGMRRELQPMIEPYQLGAPDAGGLGPVLAKIIEVVRRHHLVLPGSLPLLVKAVATGEGTALRLDPGFQLIDAVAPYARRLVLQLNSPGAWARRLGDAAPDLAWLATETPGMVRRVLGELEAGGLKVDVDPLGLEPSLRRLERIGNRIVLAMILASLIVGLGVSTLVYRPGAWIPGIGTVVTAGLVLAGLLGVALAWNVLRSPTRKGR